MNWDTVLFIAVSNVGIIQFLKGILTVKNTKIWALVQIALCFLLSFLSTYAPWAATGILGLSVSQIAYETIVQTVKKRLEQ